MKNIFLAMLLIMSGLHITAQNEDWHHEDPKKDKIIGVSTEEAYKFLKKKKRTSTKVVVAIIDSGVDVEHEDLKDNIWVNEDEIPGNGIDDDNNGYVDDVHGWNFLGGEDGKNVENENLEVTRLLRKGQKYFEGKDVSNLSASDKAEYEKYKKIKADFEKQLVDIQENKEGVENLGKNLEAATRILQNALNKEDFTKEEVMALKPANQLEQQAQAFMNFLYGNNLSAKDIEGMAEYYHDRSAYHLNPEFDPREIIGDDPSNPVDTLYGNNDVIGGDPTHGTHVAGIVGAVRTNDKGVKGIADNVSLMVIRTVPNGDERDKDVANAIRYAVNNGAQIINMSFGKPYSPMESIVDDAIAYASANRVLMVHGSGNDAENNDEVDNFPNEDFGKGENPHWINVGANDAKKDASLPATFSNYGKISVDIFAPGVDVSSTLPKSTYGENDGTSMASPVVAGVTALVMSYFPELTPEEVREAVRSALTTPPVTLRSAKGTTLAGALGSSDGTLTDTSARLVAELRTASRTSSGVSSGK
ncbi:MAG: S8 family serine peptidase [Bacteroidota bacterium]